MVVLVVTLTFSSASSPSNPPVLMTQHYYNLELIITPSLTTQLPTRAHFLIPLTTDILTTTTPQLCIQGTFADELAISTIL